MRVVTTTKKTITKQDFTDAIGETVDKLIFKDNYFIAIMKKGGDRETKIYFRCSDVKSLLGLNYNIFDIGITPVKGVKGSFEYYSEDEHLKSRFSLRRLQKTLKKLL